MNIVLNQIRISGPIESVFKIVTTARYWPQWHPSCSRVSGATERPYQLGDTVHQVAHVAGKTRRGTWRVIAHEFPQKTALQMHGGRIEVRYTFVPYPNGTRVIRRLTYPASFADGGHELQELEEMMHFESEQGMHQLKILAERMLHGEEFS